MQGTSPCCFLRWDWCFSAAKTRDLVNSSMNVNILILIKEVSIYNKSRYWDWRVLLLRGFVVILWLLGLDYYLWQFLDGFVDLSFLGLWDFGFFFEGFLEFFLLKLLLLWLQGICPDFYFLIFGGPNNAIFLFLVDHFNTLLYFRTLGIRRSLMFFLFAHIDEPIFFALLGLRIGLAIIVLCQDFTVNIQSLLLMVVFQFFEQSFQFSSTLLIDIDQSFFLRYFYNFQVGIIQRISNDLQPSIGKLYLYHHLESSDRTNSTYPRILQLVSD